MTDEWVTGLVERVEAYGRASARVVTYPLGSASPDEDIAEAKRDRNAALDALLAYATDEHERAERLEGLLWEVLGFAHWTDHDTTCPQYREQSHHPSTPVSEPGECSACDVMRAAQKEIDHE